MIITTWLLDASLALLLLLLAWGILRYRRRAASCERHSPLAGALALIVAALLILAVCGLFLLLLGRWLG